jgi:hypothetical protein
MVTYLIWMRTREKQSGGRDTTGCTGKEGHRRIGQWCVSTATGVRGEWLSRASVLKTKPIGWELVVLSLVRAEERG